ncbi:hypothetical protein KDD30_23085 (plasmid) [Photobacterium sp. GJ3]|uniref:hypothetical protein n=1 Tax=Photobacterium sp. GJ3 TaxID=2829502 RepID=UPI001B8B7D5C|nr:hypothetical protein [Photobacterium sp. GJ3]QUJ70642.1 hypothetical protein KDD30_23085 [Photobacterium sp. GJ3]
MITASLDRQTDLFCSKNVRDLALIVNDINTAYLTAGEGMPVILLHGAGAGVLRFADAGRNVKPDSASDADSLGGTRSTVRHQAR